TRKRPFSESWKGAFFLCRGADRHTKSAGPRRAALSVTVLRLYAVHQPQIDVSRNDGGQGEGDANAAEVAGLDLVAVPAQDADAGDVGRSADGGAVAAQGRAGQQAEVKDGRVDAHAGRQAGDHRQHGGNIRDVVDEGREQDRS